MDKQEETKKVEGEIKPRRSEEEKNHFYQEGYKCPAPDYDDVKKNDHLKDGTYTKKQLGVIVENKKERTLHKIYGSPTPLKRHKLRCVDKRKPVVHSEEEEILSSLAALFEEIDL